MSGNSPRVQRVIDDIEARIACRTAPPGSRLPSVRAQAKALAVSASTVVEAYARLVAQGRVVSRPGAGFYVAATAVAPLKLVPQGPPRAPDLDPLWLSRQALEADPALLKPGCGWLPSDWLYQTGVRRALRGLARGGGAELADYAPPQGSAALRQVLARRLAHSGVQVAAEQLLLTDSGTHALDLIARVFLSPGDVVLVDDPCYFNFHTLLSAHRVTLVGVPFTPQGPDLSAFEAALQTHQPKLYLTNSGLHNPTGARWSPAVAHRVLLLAEQAGLVIVEDDIFHDFELTPAPRLAAFDGLQRVIQTGSFSKTLSASVRCGYIAARPDWLQQLLEVHIATGFGGNRLAAALVLAAITDGGYARHMEQVRQRLAQRREQCLVRLAALGITPWLRPDAGMFLWCRLPHGRDAAAVARRSLEQGVVLAPGNAFSPALRAVEFMRFNVSQCDDERVFAVLRNALRAP